MRHRSERAFLVAFLVSFTAGQLRAGAYFQIGGNPIRWNQNRLLLKVPRTVHLSAGSPSGVHGSETAAQVHAAVWEAAKAWNRAEGATIKIDLELTDETQIGGSSNLVTFTDARPFDSGQCDPGTYLACALLSYTPDGAPVGVNIAFNPYKQHSSTGIAGTHDIGSVVLHELGHALGLDHSPIIDSIMNAKLEQEPLAGAPADFALRTLSRDDVRTLEAAYPKERQALIEGSVRRNMTPVSAAHVFAIDGDGHPEIGTLTGPDGRFSLPVGPGEYRLVAEPLDGPVDNRDLQSLRSVEATSFPTMFWSATGAESPDGDLIVIEAGEIRGGIDFALAEGKAKVNAETIGLVQNGSYWGFPRVTVARGGSYTLGLTRSAPYDSPAVSFPLSKVELDGAANSPSSVPQLVRQKVKLPADMPCGSYVVRYATGAGVSVLAGGLRVVANPLVELAGFANQTLVTGRTFVIRGQDLACRFFAAEPAYEGAPWPTQLDGVSVKVGARFARVLSVAPDQIVAEVPDGVSGPSAELAVLTGTGMQSPPVSVRVEPAPAKE
ncbi:MAG: matrixin family metalloprotease [Bryobacteraceae bacterium]